MGQALLATGSAWLSRERNHKQTAAPRGRESPPFQSPSPGWAPCCPDGGGGGRGGRACPWPVGSQVSGLESPALSPPGSAVKIPPPPQGLTTFEGNQRPSLYQRPLAIVWALAGVGMGPPPCWPLRGNIGQWATTFRGAFVQDR